MSKEKEYLKKIIDKIFYKALSRELGLNIKKPSFFSFYLDFKNTSVSIIINKN